MVFLSFCEQQQQEFPNDEAETDDQQQLLLKYNTFISGEG